ncbi:MAG: formate dehydrogenase accessory sulfurtransferase FdhD [Ilumatobacteraceae bacterium]
MAMDPVHRRSETMRVVTFNGDGDEQRLDELIVEQPLTIRLDGAVVATTMRTPGHDDELAVGFCFGDGLLAGAEVLGVIEAGSGSVTVDTGCQAPVPMPRLGTTTSSCGLCGNETIDALCDRLVPLPDSVPIDRRVLGRIGAAVSADQGLFAATGAVHGAAVFTAAGNVLCTREDVGRHNAVDKVVGRMLLDGALPATGLGLFISGRASFELVQKAWAAGFSTLVAVSAPTALAVHTARRARLVLAGFVRGDRINIYAPDRVDC